MPTVVYFSPAQSLLYPAVKVRGRLSDVAIDLRDTQYAAAMAIFEGNFAETATDMSASTNVLHIDVPNSTVATGQKGMALAFVKHAVPLISALKNDTLVI